ncbi:MAG: hypothetical protein ACTSXQ_07960 [Alphaproteobacteria bacterium]
MNEFEDKRFAFARDMDEATAYMVTHGAFGAFGMSEANGADKNPMFSLFSMLGLGGQMDPNQAEKMEAGRSLLVAAAIVDGLDPHGNKVAGALSFRDVMLLDAARGDGKHTELHKYLDGDYVDAAGNVFDGGFVGEDGIPTGEFIIVKPVLNDDDGVQMTNDDGTLKTIDVKVSSIGKIMKDNKLEPLTGYYMLREIEKDPELLEAMAGTGFLATLEQQKKTYIDKKKGSFKQSLSEQISAIAKASDPVDNVAINAAKGSIRQTINDLIDFDPAIAKDVWEALPADFKAELAAETTAMTWTRPGDPAKGEAETVTETRTSIEDYFNQELARVEAEEIEINKARVAPEIARFKVYLDEAIAITDATKDAKWKTANENIRDRLISLVKIEPEYAKILLEGLKEDDDAKAMFTEEFLSSFEDALDDGYTTAELKAMSGAHILTVDVNNRVDEAIALITDQLKTAKAGPGVESRMNQEYAKILEGFKALDPDIAKAVYDEIADGKGFLGDSDLVNDLQETFSEDLLDDMLRATGETTTGDDLTDFLTLVAQSQINHHGR